MNEVIKTVENQEPSWKNEFRDRIQDKRIQTDSDVEDFCDEFAVGRREVFKYLAELRVAITECKGCANIEFFGSGMYPCCVCRRGKKDMYEKGPILKRFVGSKDDDELTVDKQAYAKEHRDVFGVR